MRVRRHPARRRALAPGRVGSPARQDRDRRLLCRAGVCRAAGRSACCWPAAARRPARASPAARRCSRPARPATAQTAAATARCARRRSPGCRSGTSCAELKKFAARHPRRATPTTSKGTACARWRARSTSPATSNRWRSTSRALPPRAARADARGRRHRRRRDALHHASASPATGRTASATRRSARRRSCDQCDWYMLAQLGKFKSGMRGAHPEDTTGRADARHVADARGQHGDARRDRLHQDAASS